MMQVILDFMATAQRELDIPVGRTLEVGAMYINGTPRTVFQHLATEYIGIDIEAGDCVNLVMNGEKVSEHFPARSFDTVICCETLEHCVHPWLIVEGMKRVLKPGGHLWISTPTYGFPLHRYPLDCYRFGEDAYRLYFYEKCVLLRLAHVVDAIEQPAIVAVGRLYDEYEKSLVSALGRGH